MAATWACPVCRRRVPLREPACFCGCSRERAEREREEARQRDPSRATRELGLTLLLIVLALALAVTRRSAPPAASSFEPAPWPARPPAAPRLPPPVTAPPETAPPETLVPTPRPRPGVLAFDDPGLAVEPALPTAPPTPEPQAAPARASTTARETLRAAYVALSTEAERLDRMESDYRSRCVGTRVGAVVVNCDQIEGWLADGWRRVQDRLAEAEERARRQRVLPGDVRALREQFGADRWEQASRARR